MKAAFFQEASRVYLAIVLNFKDWEDNPDLCPFIEEKCRLDYKNIELQQYGFIDIE